jgi:hypothetical protein
VAGSRTAGEYLFKAMGGSGKVIEIQGDPSWAKPRTEGFQQVLDATPSITLAGQRSAGGDGDVAESATAILLKENPDVAGVFAHTDDMALGAAKAIAHAGLTDKVKVVGLDGSPYGLVGVKDGALAATVAQQVLLMGRTALETAIKVAAGEKVDAFVPVDMVLVTRDNVERFLAPVSAAAPGQSPAAAPAALPVVVSGTEMCDNRSNGETMPLPAGLTGGQRMVATCIDTMSDPRVSGAYVNTLAYECVGGTTACTYWGTHVLEGPDGGWDCSWTAVDFPPLSNAIIGVCPGTGGYEGMSYVFQHTSLDFGDGTSFRGVIYEGLPPAWPPMPSTASAASPAPSQ